MMLQLDDAEAAVLKQVLTDYLSDLRMEIVDTEDYDLRESMKGDEVIIKRLIANLDGSRVNAP